jgi:NAD(P)-dependent dehydrogenase (short-subunit alcohol dehydrogenase family)
MSALESNAPQKKAALITGASKRVGATIALALARAGYDIALHCNKSVQDATILREEIQKMGMKCEIFTCDLADASKLEPLISSAYKLFPHLSVLINNASVFERINFLNSSLEMFEENMAVNARAPIFLTQAFAKMVAHGHVINLLDTDIVKQHGSHFMYLLSKKTLAAFTKMAARDLRHIQVNGVCLGVVLPSDQNPENYESELEKKLPLNQLIQIDDITRSILWLLDQPRITGQFIFNDSGQHLL